MRDQCGSFGVVEKAGRLVIARGSPPCFAIVNNEARRIGRSGFDLAHMIEHSLDQPQIPYTLSLFDVESGDEFGNRVSFDRDQTLLTRAQPIEKKPPLRLVDFSGRTAEMLFG